MKSEIEQFIFKRISSSFFQVNMLLTLTANYAHIKDHRSRPKQSELSVARKCCLVEDPEQYFTTSDEEVTEELLTLDSKLKNHSEGFEVNRRSHVDNGWNYMSYSGSSDEKLLMGKKY